MKTIHYQGALTIINGEPVMMKGWKCGPLKLVKVSHLRDDEGDPDDIGVMIEFTAATGETSSFTLSHKQLGRFVKLLPVVRFIDDQHAFERLVGEI